MRVGLNFPVMVPGFDRAPVLEWSRRIDAGPFSSLCAGERVNFPNPEIFVVLSAAVAVTECVRISPTVVVVPLHPPVLLAKRMATLDVVSGGRVVLGVVEGTDRATEPRPLQPGGPEVLVGALTARSVRRAARWADGLDGFGFGPSAEEPRFAWETARAVWRAAGRGTPPRLTTGFRYALGPNARAQTDPDEAHRVADRVG